MSSLSLCNEFLCLRYATTLGLIQKLLIFGLCHAGEQTRFLLTFRPGLVTLAVLITSDIPYALQAAVLG